MGVYARQHAQQLLLDTSPLGGFGGPSTTKTKISPRAHLLLLHIAQNFAGNEQEIRDFKKKTLWDSTNQYFEGLGWKARAIGYNVPGDLDTRAIANNPDLTPNMINTVKAAVHKAAKELLVARFLLQTPEMWGRSGQTAHYRLPFLTVPCTICQLSEDPEDLSMDPTLHIPEKVRERLMDQADDWSHNMPSTKKQRAKRPANSRFKELTAANPDPWGQPAKKASEPGWGDNWGSD